MMSCKRSIKANHYLNEPPARVLLKDLAQCENPFNCPHGRPVLIHFTNSDMERMFNLNEAQARVLLKDLAQCENPFNCPHGRPVLIHFTNSDMERMFKRIQDPH